MVSHEGSRRRDIVNPPTNKRGKSEGRKKVSFIENFSLTEEKTPQKLPEPPKPTNDYS